MLGGISGTTLGTGNSFQAPPPRPDFSGLDGDKSGGLSIGELKTGLSNGSFGGASQKGETEGGRPPPPPPPPDGGSGGPGGPGGERSSVAARMLEGALDLLAAEDTEASDSAIETLFAAMDGDGDGSITGSEFRDFGEQVGGRGGEGGGGGEGQGQGAQATAAATSLYGGYQSMDAVTMLATQLTGLRM